MKILSVTESVLHSLRRKIITGELKPGQKLNECSLSEEFGISRPPLREAYRILEKDHLVVTIPQKGTYVTELSIRDFKEFSQVRRMIECFAIDLLGARNNGDLSKVTAALNRGLTLPTPFNGADPEQLFDCTKVLVDFHSSLIKSSGNVRLVYMYHPMSYSLARYQFINFQMYGTEQHCLDHHKKIFDLITNGDYDQAKEELKKHIACPQRLYHFGR